MITEFILYRIIYLLNYLITVIFDHTTDILRQNIFIFYVRISSLVTAALHSTRCCKAAGH